jgi:hypothetical protein
MKTKQKSTLEGKNRADVGASEPVETKSYHYKQSTGRNTNQTGTNVLDRPLKNTTITEDRIRGMAFTREDLHQAHRACCSVIPYEIVERVLIRRGVIIEEAV